MREVKFRAWDEENTKMLVQSPVDSHLRLMTWTGSVYNNGKLMPYIMMQYTGLKDKNGKEIYEGDCLDGIYAKGSIEWCTKCGGFMYIGNENGCLGCTRDLCPIDVVEDAHKYEIIGNIYENPELLT